MWPTGCAMSGPNGRSEVDLVKVNSEAAAAEFDANVHVADEEFPTMEEAVMLSRGIRTSISKSSAGDDTRFILCASLCACINGRLVGWIHCVCFVLHLSL